MPLPIIITGLFILTGAFGYSILSMPNRMSGTSVLDVRDTAIKEMMSSEVMTMDGMGRMMFADGAYSNAVQYEIPYGYVEPMEVSLSFAGGVITEANVVFNIVNPTSADYQSLFEKYYKSEVIGKPIGSVSLARLGGASLTNKAFDTALERMKQESRGVEVIDDEIVPLIGAGGNNNVGTTTD